MHARRTSACTLAAALGAALMLASAPAAAQGPLPADSLSRARTWSFWFMAGVPDSIAAHMLPDVLTSIGGRTGLVDAQAMIAERAGTEKRLVEERFVWRNGKRQYWRVMEMTTLPEPFVLRFVMDEQGRIAGLGLGPQSATPPVDSGGVAIKP